MYFLYRDELLLPFRNVLLSWGFPSLLTLLTGQGRLVSLKIGQQLFLNPSNLIWCFSDPYPQTHQRTEADAELTKKPKQLPLCFSAKRQRTLGTIRFCHGVSTISILIFLIDWTTLRECIIIFSPVWLTGIDSQQKWGIWKCLKCLTNYFCTLGNDPSHLPQRPNTLLQNKTGFPNCIFTGSVLLCVNMKLTVRYHRVIQSTTLLYAVLSWSREPNECFRYISLLTLLEKNIDKSRLIGWILWISSYAVHDRSLFEESSRPRFFVF